MNIDVLKYLEPAKLNFNARAESIASNFSKISLNSKNNHFITEQISDKFIIIGIPDDRGVIANLGNPGAKEGPKFFRESFYKMYDTKIMQKITNSKKLSQNLPSTSVTQDFLSDKITDVGNIILANTIEETHDRLADVIEFLLSNNPRLIFVIGGGHDFTYGSYKGHVKSKENEIIPIINLDAHFDLRPVINNEINSGTAFYRIIKDFNKNIANGKALLEIGIQRERNPHSLFNYAMQNGIKTVEYISLLNIWKENISGNIQIPSEHIHDHIDDCSKFGFERKTGSLHISLCLDIFDQALAPGTSASTPIGAQMKDLSQTFAYFGKSNTCRIMDIAELCPARDTLDQTARLCASIVYRIILLREEYSNR
ncbi:formimidoylglutamase [Fluviispira sanaruensis]|uniref:Arginase n=1 Tax=Fluviispira sanaruensis TaxID=2493639 RepID=A0A4P2VXP4_FLUSA|nr:formimidoylglutamase [Fluviispira sanaruensis]BBH54425.1 arginase [Fluviispira sanaruensis]